ncbi:hypothetical protein L6164_008048 [Bauhinia variegata]|uniref:Uncharacterized protein n=1 Tax=Bauhinia variegata TaxID=167791 RepID=A0ACB9PFL6_BAUVA|nr:hypothetical protein L6164_008048 [Bauhinia variegata]
MSLGFSGKNKMLLSRIGFGCVDPLRPDRREGNRSFSRLTGQWVSAPLPERAFLGVISERKNDKRQSICTADELHYVSVPNSDWKLALWRYLPSPVAPTRNHPLLLLSGVATNAVGYDLSPQASFARYMSAQGFDTWTLEVRGAGLSTNGVSLMEDKQYLSNLAGIDSALKQDSTYTKGKGLGMMETLTRLSDRLSDFLSGDLLEAGRNSSIASQISDLNRRLQTIIEEAQRLLFPRQVLNLQELLSAAQEEFQKLKYDWDFDHYLEEDVPAAMEYIRTQSQSKDGKLLAIGHSMGGILLYAMLSRCCFDGKDSGLASIVTLASSLDYTPSRSSLKLLLPLAQPAQALNVPVIPVGPLISIAYPLANYPPYVLSWLKDQITARDMMDQELLEKLAFNNFCTVPSKLLLQLTTAFNKGGLRDRSGSFFYKDHLHKSNVPILALAGDQDLICPPEAVYETVKLIPENLVTYKVFGEPGGPHYAHYDLVGGRLAADEVYPCITEFLFHHDMA